ncbi:hypothetical protein [Aeromonas enteropelogenes]|uniref:hypothetical protein n=1 Tax=Aeromonas enteropelogenes TaxID=29489 RepID=UPI003B9E92EA
MFGVFTLWKLAIITQTGLASGLTIMQASSPYGTEILAAQSGRFSTTPEFASLGATFFSEKNG